jgi:predicted transcriptional regulator
MNKLSRKRIINTLKGLGLSNIDIQVYIFLAKNGPHELRDVASALKLKDREVTRSVKDLQGMTVVIASIQHPLEFMALPFEEVIDLLIEVKKEQAKAMQQAKNELLSSWRKMTKEPSEKS